jgi:putative FmdB family regulatory protein
MPQYDWKCKECSATTTVTRRMSEYETPPEKCDQCGSTELERTIAGGTSFNLEGGGWFRDGY